MPPVDGNACCLKDECRVISEGKNQKKQVRLIFCRVCNNSFHAVCVNYHTKSDSEFALAVNIFSCNKCFQLIEAISEQIHNKFSSLINSLQSSIDKMSTELADLKTVVSNNSSDTVLTVHDATNTKECTALDNSTDAKNLKLSKEIVNKQDNNATSFQSEQNIEQNNKTVINKYFLCSVETELSLDDIRLILEDASVPLTEIDLIEAKGEFKRKRYVEIFSNNAVCLFKFKRAFNSSNLNGSWFLRETPPKQHKPENSKPYKPSSINNKNTQEKNHTNFYHHQTRNHSFPTKNNNRNKYYYNDKRFAQKQQTYPLINYKNTPLQTNYEHYQHTPLHYNQLTQSKNNNTNINNGNYSNNHQSQSEDSTIPFLEKLLCIAKKM